MARIERFEDIEAWQNARELVKQVYQVTNKEGVVRITPYALRYTPAIPRCLLPAVSCILPAARDLGYLDDSEFRSLSDAATMVSKQVASFIHYLQKTDYAKS